LQNSAAKQLLLDKCGITEATVLKYSLGWTGERYVWPVFDEHGLVRNLRMYKYGDTSGSKVIHYTTTIEEEKVSYGSHNLRLFPIQALQNDPQVVFLVEGEKDALNMNQAGFAAVSATGGAGSWQPDTCNLPLRGKHVIICYDVDEKGKLSARKIAQLLRPIVASVTVYDLPSDGLPSHGDVTDFLLLIPTSSEQLHAVITKVLAGSDEATALSLYSLGDTKNPVYNNKLLNVDAHVVGKETTPYTADRGYNIACPQSRGNVCKNCGLGSTESGTLDLFIGSDSKDLLYTIERTDVQVRAFIAEQAGIVRCPLWTAEPVEAMRSSVEKILLSTTIDQRKYDGSSEYVQQMAYVVDTPITSNSVYTMLGRMTTHPRDQANTFIITKATTSKLSIDTFETTPEVFEALQFFQPKNKTVESIIDRLRERWDDLSANVTKIYKRRNIHIVTDLVAHSLLRFEIFGSVPDRGWLEGYIGGDTRQGKSEVSKRLHQHYKAGELVVAENASLSGILGGAQKLANGEWMVSWGKCPLNDRGWVTFDECQNISLMVMGALSGMRSSGVAEIDKIRVERVQARTRLLWLSNPRSENLNVDQLAQGVQLVPDVFGRAEDIARLDLISIVRSVDMPSSVLRSNLKVEHTHTSELCHLLIMFAWSRTSGQVIFTEEASEECMSSAERMAEKYHSDIKVVERMEQRVKMARISASIAALCFSSPDGVKLIVDRIHVLAAEQLCYELFDDPAVGYNEYALSCQNAEDVRDSSGVLNWCKDKHEELLRALLQQRELRLFDLQNYANLDRERAQSVMSYLVTQRAIVLRGGNYVKSSGFVKILRTALDKHMFSSNGALNGSAKDY
jgi:hypothetical protein